MGTPSSASRGLWRFSLSCRGVSVVGAVGAVGTVGAVGVRRGVVPIPTGCFVALANTSSVIAAFEDARCLVCFAPWL